MISAKARSAVAASSTPGVFVTVTPARRAGGDVDPVVADAEVRDTRSRGRSSSGTGSFATIRPSTSSRGLCERVERRHLDVTELVEGWAWIPAGGEDVHDRR